MSLAYWKECIAEAADECGAVLTNEQIEFMADAVQGSHENYRMYHGHESLPNPLKTENESLKRELRAEQEKVPCKICNSKGINIDHGPVHSGLSQCWRCRGEGRHKP